MWLLAGRAESGEGERRKEREHSCGRASGREVIERVGRRRRERERRVR